MVGAFATGKTSLVARFVKGIYSDKYQTTVGVKIDKKTVNLSNCTLNMVLWDIHGEDDFQDVRMSYLRGAAAYLLVIDGTRRTTMETALKLRDKVTDTIGDLPFTMVVNKVDLQSEWEVTADDIEQLKATGTQVVLTSAKDDTGVEKCFLALAQKMMQVG